MQSVKSQKYYPNPEQEESLDHSTFTREYRRNLTRWYYNLPANFLEDITHVMRTAFKIMFNVGSRYVSIWNWKRRKKN